MNLSMNKLEWILSLRRKYNTEGDEVLCKYLDTIRGMKQDDFGNRILQIGNKPNILFSAHTDTVHWNKSKALKQKVVKDTAKKEYFLDESSGCLGADDGAGVWILTKLIEAKIPGLYIFHRGEECGGLGSSYISESTPELLKGIDIAIAFDRRGKKDIITEQSCGKCASEEFAESFAKQLKLGHLSARGSFTDTANYAGQIRECTNVSVGYEHEHSARETLNYAYLRKLMRALLKVDWSALVVKREVTDFGIYSFPSTTYRGTNYSHARKQKYLTLPEISKLIKDRPEEAAYILNYYGVTEADCIYAKSMIQRKQTNRRKQDKFDKYYY